mgnify:CR=1 FL=1
MNIIVILYVLELLYQLGVSYLPTIHFLLAILHLVFASCQFTACNQMLRDRCIQEYSFVSNYRFTNYMALFCLMFKICSFSGVRNFAASVFSCIKKKLFYVQSLPSFLRCFDMCGRLNAWSHNVCLASIKYYIVLAWFKCHLQVSIILNTCV